MVSDQSHGASCEASWAIDGTCTVQRAVACLASWGKCHAAASEVCGLCGRHLNLGDTTLTSRTSSSQSCCCVVCVLHVCICRSSCTNCSLTVQRRTGQAQAVTRVSIRPKRLGTWSRRLFPGLGKGPDLDGLIGVGRCPGPPSKQAGQGGTAGQRQARTKGERMNSCQSMMRRRSWAGWAVHLGSLGGPLGGVAAGMLETG